MKKYLQIFILFLVTFTFGITGAKAGALSISASSTNVIKGGSVIIRIKASEVAGKVSLSSSNPSVLSGGISSVWVENDTQTYTFKANENGSATVTLSAIDVSDSNGNAYTASKSVTINVYTPAPVVLSSNNNLSSLGVEGKELTPGFAQGTLEYSVEMDPETTKVNLTGSVADSSASVSGLGERDVTDGDNRLEVIVTAQNGTTKTYVVNVKVKEYNPINVDINSKNLTVIRKKGQIEAPANYNETTLKIGDEEVNAFHSDITGYTLVGLKDEEGNANLYIYEDGKYTLYNEYSFAQIKLYPMEANSKDIPSLYHKTTIKLNNKDVVAYKLDDASDYALIYGMNVDNGKTNLYMYNETENTIQLYTREEMKVFDKKLNTYVLAIAVLSGVSVLLFILCIVLLISKRNKKDKSDTEIKVTQINKPKRDKKTEDLAREVLNNDKFRL